MNIKVDDIETFKHIGIIVNQYTAFIGHGILGYGCKIYMGAGLSSSSLGCYSYTDSFINFTEIGNYCSIAKHVEIALPHPTDRLTTSPLSYRDEDQFYQFKIKRNFPYAIHTSISHDSWIGVNVSIKAGVHIGTGAIIGAGAVVTHDVPDFAIVGGVPAKIIRMRFSDAMIERIQKSQWFLYEWKGVEIEWNNPEKALDTMESMIAEDSVSKPKIFAYQADEHSLTLQEFQK